MYDEREREIEIDTETEGSFKGVVRPMGGGYLFYGRSIFAEI